MAGGEETANRHGGLGRGGESVSPTDYWAALSAERERDLPEGRIGGVIAQLRRRGRVANTRANITLACLVATVALGLFYYIGQPLIRDAVDGKRIAWQDDVTTWTEGESELDAERAALRDHLVRILSPAAELVPSGTDADLSSLIVLPNSETAIAAGATGAIIQSTDDGQSWLTVGLATDEDPDFRVLLALPDGRTAIAAGDDGAIKRTEDGGGKWDPVESGVKKASLTLLKPVNDHTVLAAGDGGVITLSTDGGEHFRKVNSKTTANIHDLLMLPDARTVIAAGDDGMITRSTDGGEHWTAVQSGLDETTPIGDLLALSDGTSVIALAQHGMITRSKDGGEHWAEVDSDVDADLLGAIALPDSKTVIAVGDHRTITRSTDGGLHWQAIGSDIDPDAAIETLKATPDGRVVIAASDKAVMRSTDGGAHWTATNAAGENLLMLPGGETVFVAGTAIFRSTDAGEHWNEIPSGASRLLGSLHALPDGQTVVAAGDGGAILRVSDRLANELAALQLAPGDAGDDSLFNWIVNPELAQPFRAFPTIVTSRDQMQDIKNRRAGVDEPLALATRKLAAIKIGSESREEQQAAFAAFMKGCREGATAADAGALTSDCTAAYAASQADATRNWWSLLAERVPPGILLLFLLATLSALYRYNIRLAGFHHGRADALELLDVGITVADLTPISDALAADKVPFNAGKTPADQATELASALISRAK